MRESTEYQTQPSPVRVTDLRILAISLAALVAFISACDQQRPPETEAPPMAQAAEPTQPAQLPKLSPPKLIEVQDAVKRVFKDAALIDTARSFNFMAGDFNGDLSQDIAVVLRVAPGKVAQMNEGFAPWILRDPIASIRPGRQQLRVEQDDILLAVIHGYGANDWRDSQATQTYLLKNAVGSRMEVHVGKEFLAANAGKKLPRLNGDLIGGVLRGTNGYLYYSGESYAWYDPKTFKGEPPRRFVHSRRART